MIVDILDNAGNVIGSLTLPDDTPDEVVQAQLSLYIYQPPQPNQIDLVTNAVTNAMKFCSNLIKQFASENQIMGIAASGLSAQLVLYLHDCIHALLLGNVFEVIALLDSYIQDTSDAKAALYPFITNTRLESYKNQVQTYLGIPLT